MHILCIGDAMIPGVIFEKACAELDIQDKTIQVKDWESDWDKLQHRRLQIEKKGPGIESIQPQIKEAHPDTEMLLFLFAPISSEVMDSLPKLRIIGAARAGLENVDVRAATERDIIVHHLKGRNAHAVSDFTIGLIFSEVRNIGRAHHAIMNNIWRKKFVNSDYIPEMAGKTLGIIGFGYIGRLVAKKLSGFEIKVLVYDPFVTNEEVKKHGGTLVSKEELFQNSDVITLHARLSKENEGMIGEKEIDMMKPTSIIVNTARAGLIDEDALYSALEKRKIAGAALDVFWKEPLPENSRWHKLDNVTLTSHIAGTTADALNKSPYMLIEDINRLLNGEEPKFIVNPNVLNRAKCKQWLDSL